MAWTRWPPTSTLARSVWTNAARLCGSPSEAWPRAISIASLPSGMPIRPSVRPTARPAFSTWRPASTGSTSSEPGNVAARSSPLHPAPEPTARHQRQALYPVGELVGELHRDPAAQGMADDGRGPELERQHQVADARRERAHRVVAAGLGALPMAEQVGRQHRVVAGQPRRHGLPDHRGGGDAVDQHDRRAAARHAGRRPGGRGSSFRAARSSSRVKHPRSLPASGAQAPRSCIARQSMRTVLTVTYYACAHARTPRPAGSGSIACSAGF